MNIKLSDNNKYVELIRQSFKKLKSAIFFDKTQLVLRDKLIAYETSPDFESNLNDLTFVNRFTHFYLFFLDLFFP